MKRATPHLARKFIADRRGIAGVEFAVILPAIFILFMGIVETSNFITVNQRTEKMAHSIADLVAQEDAITTAHIDTILGAAAAMMHPFEFGPQGHVIITAVHRAAGQEAKVAWQYEGGGDLDEVDSNFGATGFGSVLPSGFTLNERETVIIAEVFYDYRSMLTELFSSGERLYKYAFYKPRLGTLDTVQSQ